MSRGSPASTPASISASAIKNTYAGPDPDRPVTASSWLSGTVTTAPTTYSVVETGLRPSTWGTATTIGTATGTFAVGDVISGSGVVAGTKITANIAGTGGTGGTMVVDNNTVVASTTITASTAVETNFYCRSQGLPGETVKISTYPLASGA